MILNLKLRDHDASIELSVDEIDHHFRLKLIDDSRSKVADYEYIYPLIFLRHLKNS